MRSIKSFSVLLVMTLALGVVAFAEEKAADQAAAEKSAAKKVRLTKPWSQLDTLSEDQRQKIADIHAKAVADIKAIQQREREEITALLTDEQKAQVEELAAQDKAKRKAKADKSDKAADDDGAEDGADEAKSDDAAGAGM